MIATDGFTYEKRSAIDKATPQIAIHFLPLCRCIMEWFKTKRSSPTTGAALLRRVPARSLVSFAFTRTPPVFVSVRSHACSQRRFDTQPFPQEPDKPVEGKDGAAVACVFACCSQTFAVRSVTVLRLLRSQPGTSASTSRPRRYTDTICISRLRDSSSNARRNLFTGDCGQGG